MPGRVIFEKHLSILGKEYKKSELRKNIPTRNWYYSVCATPLYLNGVLLCGLNWGADDSHSPQKDYPQEKFMNIEDLGSLARPKDYLRSYLRPHDQDKITQIHICFFKTKNESDLTSSDFALSNPIFPDFIKDLQPRFLLAMSSKIAPVFGRDLTQIDSKEVQRPTNDKGSKRSPRRPVWIGTVCICSAS